MIPKIIAAVITTVIIVAVCFWAGYIVAWTRERGDKK